MKNILGFFIWLIAGYVIGIIAKNNPLSGISILLFGFILLFLTFYKSWGWFDEGDNKIILFSFIFVEIIGFIFGVTGLITVNKKYSATFIITFLLSFLFYIIIKDFLNFLTLKRKKTRTH